ncbi:leucine-rich repeat extensin-like protein 5 [Tetranychus urticae]|uniref:DUF4794 domain-containing protein n=1 Tax=Tetranychus urticae TaxID=32264 RepID=T1KYS3_TETUR|nr:leucine-rich repeat extensin-like protein 5 [Tetranychus urticae]
MVVTIQMFTVLVVTLVYLACPSESFVSIKSLPPSTTTTSPPTNKLLLNKDYNFSPDYSQLKGSQPDKLNLTDDKRNPFNLRKSLTGPKSGKYREVEEVTPSNEIDEEAREPEIFRQPKEVRDPKIPEIEPESGPIDPNTPGYAGPPPSGPPPAQPSLPVPPSSEYPGIASSPDSPPQTFPTNLFPAQRPNTVPSLPPPESDNEQPSPYYPPTVQTPPQLYPNNFYASPSPPTAEIPIPPPPPPPQPHFSPTVYQSYSPPAWLTNFYTHSVDYYSNYPYSGGLVSSYSPLEATLKHTIDPSYLIQQTISPIERSQFTSVAPYIASPSVTTIHSHANPLYYSNTDETRQVQGNQEQQFYANQPTQIYVTTNNNESTTKETNEQQIPVTKSDDEKSKESFETTRNAKDI